MNVPAPVGYNRSPQSAGGHAHRAGAVHRLEVDLFALRIPHDDLREAEVARPRLAHFILPVVLPGVLRAQLPPRPRVVPRPAVVNAGELDRGCTVSLNVGHPADQTRPLRIDRIGPDIRTGRSGGIVRAATRRIAGRIGIVVPRIAATRVIGADRCGQNYNRTKGHQEDFVHGMVSG